MTWLRERKRVSLYTSNETKMALIATRTKMHRVLLQNGAFGKVGAMCSSSSAVVESRPVGLGMLGLKDYEDYRRSLYGEITHKALLVDAAGTLLVPSQPMAQVPSSLSLSYRHVCLCMYVIFGLMGLSTCGRILGIWVACVCVCVFFFFALLDFWVKVCMNWTSGFCVNVLN